MWIKICCIQDRSEAEIAIAAGASAIGLVSAMPSGPGPIPESHIAEIAAAVRGRVESVLLTALTDPAAVAEQHARCRTDALQLVDRLPPGGLMELGRLRPGIRRIQVVHVTGDAAMSRAQEAAAEGADALLLDSGRPQAAVRELGGTGRTHDWAVSRRIVEAASVPVYLAGGLGPGNGAEAAGRVGPAGLDLCSGVRTDDRLDPVKLRAFMCAVRAD